MAAAVEIFASSIVALGSFNSSIFTPDWLERNNLVGADDAQSARSSDSLVITRQVTHVATEWFDLQVLDGRLALESKTVLSPQLKDLAVGMFSLLLQTPITAIGLNFTAHYKVDTIKDYHKIGDVLAPKLIWKELYPGDQSSLGMQDLTIAIQPHKRDETPKTKDRRNISVQPSSKVKNGVFFSFNDHHEIVAGENDRSTAAEIALRIIEQHWQSSWDDAVRVFEGVLERTLKS